jgi:Leucine-rich repeat (LRR) protein
MVLVELECLRRLRELRADYNMIRDFTGLKNLENLKKLSLAHNKIEEVDLECCHWWVGGVQSDKLAH